MDLKTEPEIQLITIKPELLFVDTDLYNLDGEQARYKSSDIFDEENIADQNSHNFDDENISFQTLQNFVEEYVGYHFLTELGMGNTSCQDTVETNRKMLKKKQKVDFHQTKKIFKCPRCNYAKSYHMSLKRHIYMHHPEIESNISSTQRLSCNICHTRLFLL
eukprot:GFUD01071653.1.p1 GENE.GFUD01071653.1~~GFUD01071653.1.p1  ORF type:complete len:162 (-),score=29.77 GFUD01071653.1:169-654(-)